MLKLKYILFLYAFGFIIFSSCKDDTTDNPAPMVTINGEVEKKATIKYSMQDEYEVLLEITDGNPPFTINMDNIPNVTVNQGFSQVEGTILTLNDSNTAFTLRDFARPADNDDIEIIMDIQVSDKNFLSGEARLELIILGNHKPEAELTINLDPNDIPYARNINGCSSIDGDADYGGDITKYRFEIARFEEQAFYDYEGDSCYINYVFPDSGTYTITLEVMDNEGAWSEKIDTVFIID